MGKKFYAFDDLALLPNNDVCHASIDPDSEEEQERALVDAIFNDPANIEQFKDEPCIMEHIYLKVLSQAPPDLVTLFEIARRSCHPALLARLTKKAVAMGQADALAFLLLRHFQDWNHPKHLVGILLHLVRRVKPDTAIHILRASNPAKNPRLRQVLNVDAVWQRVVSSYIESRDLTRAYLALLWAGCGFRVNEDDPAYRELSLFKRDFIMHMKDWHANDDLYWRVFGRASKAAFAQMVRQVWQAHNDARELLPDIWGGVESFPVKVLVKSGECVSIHTRMRKLPYSGLVARFIEGKVQTDFFTHLPFLRRARIAHAPLSLIGAMLQQLIIHHATKEVGIVRVPPNFSAPASKPYASLTMFDLLQRLSD